MKLIEKQAILKIIVWFIFKHTRRDQENYKEIRRFLFQILILNITSNRCDIYSLILKVIVKRLRNIKLSSLDIFTSEIVIQLTQNN